MILCSSSFLRFPRIALGTAAILSLGFLDVAARDPSKDWIVMENCRLVINPANDGDSFHARADAKEYIFRLYFIDAPETDRMTLGRLVEQAKYFGITVPQAIEVGRAAREFTREKLSEPFTVFTHLTDAMGQSKLERFYALVKAKDGDLGEQLVRNGLARIYGYKAAPPGLLNSRLELEKLQQLERQARQERIGAWGRAGGTSSQRSGAPNSPRGPGDPRRWPPNDTTPLGKIDINTATEKELRTVPGIGPVSATRIIAARPFHTANQLRKK